MMEKIVFEHEQRHRKNDLEHEQFRKDIDKNASDLNLLNEDIKSLWAAVNNTKSVEPIIIETTKQEESTAFDISILEDLYASKKAPDLTLYRIEELEKQVEKLRYNYTDNIGNVGNQEDNCESEEEQQEEEDLTNNVSRIRSASGTMFLSVG